MVYICTKFHEYILDGIKIIERSLFSYEKFQIKNVHGVSVLVLCTSPDVVYVCTKFHENSLDGIKVIERTIFIGKISKGHNAVKL